MYTLIESLYENVKGAWDELFERSYGFWPGILDGAVAPSLDCGILDRLAALAASSWLVPESIPSAVDSC